MAKRTRLDLRRESEAAERIKAEGGTIPGAAPAKKKAAAKKPGTASKSKKAKKADAIRMRMVWGIFDNGNQQVASFPYAARAEAEAKLAEIQEKGKGPYFLQPVREAMPADAAPMSADD